MRSRSGLRRSASIGKAGGGAVMPYGYKKDGVKGMLIVDDEEKVIVEKIFKMYSEGKGTKVIARILNNDNIPTKYHSLDKNPKQDKKWSDAVVLRIITNTIYKGERNFKGEKFNAPVIISKKLFDKCDEIRQNKTHRNYMTKYTYLLKDKIYCGKCQRNYFAKYKPQKGGDKVYVCSSKLSYAGHCGCPSLNISLIESVLYYILKNTDSLFKHIKSSEDQINLLKTQNDDFQKQNSDAQKEAVKYKAEQNRLLDAYLKEGTTISEELYNQKNNEYKKHLENCDSLIERTSKAIQKNKNSITSLSSKRSKEEFLHKMKGDRNQLRLVFDEIFSRLVVNEFDEQSALVTVFIQINSVELKDPLQLLVNIHGMRRNPKKYQFKSDVDINAVEKSGTDELGEVWSTDNFNFLNWIDVPQEFILKMEQSE